MKAPWLLFFPWLIFFLAACGSSDQDPFQPLETPLKQSQSSGAHPLENQQLEEAINQLRQEAYSAALNNLKSASDQSADTESFIQHLIEQPKVAYEIFDGCSNYWREIEPPGDLSEEAWNRSILLDHYESFPSMPQHTRIYSMTPGKYLVIMPCWIGPYWEASTNYIYDETGPQEKVTPLRLPTYDIKTGQVIPGQSAINRGVQDYDEESQELTLVYKFRGPGDCGLKATYLLENDELTLTEFREHFHCDGSRNPDDYPQLYP